MTEAEQKLLYDISEAIALIQNFTLDLNFLEYVSSQKTKSAVERQLIIIGEAINNLHKESQTIQISSAQQIIGFRNRIVHAYDSIDDTIVWAIVTKHLPLLEQEINELLTAQ